MQDETTERAARDGRKRVLIIIGGGGYRFEAESLARQLRDEHDIIVATTAKWNVAKVAESLDAPLYEIPRIRTFKERNPVLSVWNFLRVLWKARTIIAESRPDAIIATGTNLGVPMFIWGRIKGVRCIFIESITRVETWSATTRLVLALRLCDRVFVQWPESADPARGVRYEGTVL